MRIRIVSFTEKGRETAARVIVALGESGTISAGEALAYDKAAGTLAAFTEAAFREGTPLVFVSALGIAVRTIAPFVKDKLTDPPVLVLDEQALHVIPVLSGHYGGANELAARIAAALGAEPVITTATDVNGAFSVDVFARENGLKIGNREGIARVSTKALAGKPVSIAIQDYPPTKPVDVLIRKEPGTAAKGTAAGSAETAALSADGPVDAAVTLCLNGTDEALRDLRLAPPGFVLGIGCRRGKGKEEIRAFVSACLAEAGISLGEVSALASIDLKAEEEGLLALARELGVPFFTFTASLLAKAEGEFTPSEFVRQTAGVDNVCERAAVLAAGSGGELIMKKHAAGGVTCACARAYGR
ncbi:MAG: cobalamin biosynthesis protein [Firmicutes bacterium]|nr:cobalamin biosynthesis protein [Bacillota bacterium]